MSRIGEVINVLDVLTEALAQSTAINDYCNTNFSKDQTVYQGVNYEDPPGVAEAPFFIIAEPAQIWKDGGFDVEFVISTVVNQPSIDTSTALCVIYDGVEQSLKLSALAQKAIVDHIQGRIVCKPQFIEGVHETLFPLFSVSVRLVLNFLNNNRLATPAIWG